MLSLHTFLDTTVFIKNKLLSSPEQGFTSDWGLHQIRNDAEWFKAEFYKQGTL